MNIDEDFQLQMKKYNYIRDTLTPELKQTRRELRVKYYTETRYN